MDDYTKIDWSNPLSKHPLNDGLVGWWLVTPHNRGSFTWYDLSGNNYHGALTNMAQDDWVGKVNRHKGWGALDFDGTNDFVDAGNIPELEFIPRVTFSAWMKRNASGDYVSFGTYDPANADMLFLTQDADGNVYFWIGDGSFNAGYFTLNNTVWQHIIFTFDGDESVAADRVKGYINGVETTITNFGTLPTLTPVIADNFLIGKENTPNFTKGFIDDVRVYKRLLSPVESQDLYFRSLVHQKGLLLYRPNRKLFVPVGAVTVTPATLTLVSALLAPTIVADQNPTITPATLALTSTLQSPSFSTNDSYSPATLALALTLQAPTISIDDSYSPATLPLALTLQSPSFSTDDSYSPAALALALTPRHFNFSFSSLGPNDSRRPEPNYHASRSSLNFGLISAIILH